MELEIKTLIHDVLNEYELPRELENEYDLIVEGGVDSLGMLSLATAVQKHFDVNVPDHEWASLCSIDAIRRFVEERRTTLPFSG